MSVDKILILLVYNRECMERNVMTSFRILSSFECFYVSNKMISFFTLKYELFTSCNVSNNASLVSAGTREGFGVMVNQKAWTAGGGGDWWFQKFPDLCGYPLWMTPSGNLSFWWLFFMNGENYT